MIFEPITKEAYQLFHDGQRVLSVIEKHGIRIDRQRAEANKAHITRQIDRIAKGMEKYPVIRAMRKQFGDKFNLDSDDQMRWVLFEHLGLEPPKKTKGGKNSVDKSVMQDLDIDFIEDMQTISRLSTVKNTYLTSILREMDDEGFIHPMFGLTNVSTYRSSASNPNFQNMPIRDKEQSAPIRSCIIPRDGFHFGEADFSGVEVRIAATYHQDPVMLEYLLDDSKDMHRDSAMNCFMLTQEQMTKQIRYCGKNMWVFPQFYGDWYASCAKSLWKAVKRMKLATADGTPLYDHLADNGIKTLAQFEKHLQGFEDMFWNEWFTVYTQWKKDWYARYLRDGFFVTKTGFRIAGELEKNQVLNFPIQGDAFHCLLQVLIWLQDELSYNQWQTHLLGQIHDSMVMEIAPHELRDCYELVKQLVCTCLPDRWQWINVPMKFEMEVAPVNESWFNKKEYRPE